MDDNFIKAGDRVSCGYPDVRRIPTVETIKDVWLDEQRFQTGIGVLIDDTWLDSSWVKPTEGKVVMTQEDDAIAQPFKRMKGKPLQFGHTKN